MASFSTISIIINVGLLIWAIYERIISAKDKADIKASIRQWQHQAKGLSGALSRIRYSCKDDDSNTIWVSFSDKKDVGIALDALHEVSESLAESLYETRFFSDKELKEILNKEKTQSDEKEEKRKH